MIDDYVTKPFSMPILLRKIQAIFRRIDNDLNTKQELIQYKDIVLNMNEYTVSINKEFIDFTRKEFEILKELLAHPGYVQTREMLLDKVWQYEYYDSDRVVDNHIKNIRKKLGKDYIKTVKGIIGHEPKVIHEFDIIFSQAELENDIQLISLPSVPFKSAS